MEGEQFSLCWNNFHNNLTSGFHSLLEDEDFVDVTIAAEGQFLKAHKMILSVCSPFFKDLFRVNPSKHPIVILPDVNYSALCNVMQFMYQGEVSVNQEDLPTFMRVAELLKVKGLTDNPANAKPTAQEPNGLSMATSKRRSVSPPIQRQIMKRPRPTKKLIKPIQHLRPLGTPPLKSPRSPLPAKKPNFDEPSPLPLTTKDTSVSKQVVDVSERASKMEMAELHEGSSRHSDGDGSLDMSIAQESFSPSPSPSSHQLTQMPPQMTPTDLSHSMDSQDSSPGTLRCIIGKRGHPRLIIDGHSFYKKSRSKSKEFWYCKRSRNREKCSVVCWTQRGKIVKWPDPMQHAHPIFPENYIREIDNEVPIEELEEILIKESYQASKAK